MLLKLIALLLPWVRIREPAVHLRSTPPFSPTVLALAFVLADPTKLMPSPPFAWTAFSEVNPLTSPGAAPDIRIPLPVFL